MSYPEPGYGDDSFREAGDFRSSETTVPDGYSAPRFSELSSTDTAPTRPVTAAELDDVFDDPEHGQPGMDRMGVHVLWEILLLVGVVLVGLLLPPLARSADRRRQPQGAAAAGGLARRGRHRPGAVAARRRGQPGGRADRGRRRPVLRRARR